VCTVTPEQRQNSANLCHGDYTPKSLSEAIDNIMKRKQFLKLWKAIADSTNVKETISTFENKKGYGGKRTLERCSQAAAGFKEGLSSEVIAEKTGWSLKYVGKIRAWWEQEVAIEAVIKQNPCEFFPGVAAQPPEKSLIIHGLSSGTNNVQFMLANVSTYLIVVDNIYVEILRWEKYNKGPSIEGRIITCKYTVKLKTNFIGEILIKDSKFRYPKGDVDSFSISFISPLGYKYITRINFHCSEVITTKRFIISTDGFELRFYKSVTNGGGLPTHDAVAQAQKLIDSRKKAREEKR